MAFLRQHEKVFLGQRSHRLSPRTLHELDTHYPTEVKKREIFNRFESKMPEDSIAPIRDGIDAEDFLMHMKMGMRMRTINLEK